MTQYSIVPVQPWHVDEAAENMRIADVRECWAFAHHEPAEALAKSVQWSRRAYAGLADDVVMCVGGVAEASLISTVGYPWMLGTEALPLHARAFLRHSRGFVRQARKEYSVLVNFVDARHRDAIRWLRWLGFQMPEASILLGPDSMPFYEFKMTGESRV